MTVKQVSLDQWPRLSLGFFVGDRSHSSMIVTVLLPKLAIQQPFFLQFLPSISQLLPTKSFSVIFLAKMKFCLVAIYMCGAMKERQTFSFCTVLEGKETGLMVI